MGPSIPWGNYAAWETVHTPSAGLSPLFSHPMPRTFSISVIYGIFEFLLPREAGRLHIKADKGPLANTGIVIPFPLSFAETEFLRLQPASLIENHTGPSNLASFQQHLGNIALWSTSASLHRKSDDNPLTLLQDPISSKKQTSLEIFQITSSTPFCSFPHTGAYCF